MNANRYFAWAVVLVSCASPRPAEKPQPQADVMLEMMANAQMLQANVNASRDRAEADCAPLKQRPVPWAEERFWGERMALRSALKGKGLIDDADPQSAAALVAYVQRVGLWVATKSARPDIEWTIGVVDDATPWHAWQIGGYVLVSSGLLAGLTNEAELAAVLAHGVAHIASTALSDYALARHNACVVTLTGDFVVAASAKGMGMDSATMSNARFGKTMRRFASTESLDLETDPDVDRNFQLWFLERTLQSLALSRSKATEEAVDAVAHELLRRAGYDTAALEKTLPLLNEMDVSRLVSDRSEALATLKPANKGKTPPFPKAVKWPK